MPNCISKPVHATCHEAGHTWSPSCTLSAIEIFINCFKYSLKLYTPVYVVSGIVSRRRKEYFIKKLYKEILQSSLFLACNGGFMVSLFCVIRKVFGSFRYYTTGFIPGFISSLFAILVERKSRRGALAIYMMNQAIDTTFNILKSSGYAFDVHHGEVLIFAATMSALMYMYKSDNLPDGFIKTIFESGLKPKEQIEDSRQNNDISYIKLSCQLVGKAFAVGYSLQATFNLLTCLSKIFSKPGTVLQSLVRSNNLRSGAFLGSFVGIYKLVDRLLQKIPKSNKNLNAALAGGLAGLSMMFQKSSTLALYILSKTIELFYMNGIQKGMFPYLKHFDSFLYAICTGIMFHAAVLQPLFLRNTYWQFLLRLTGARFDVINRAKWDVWGLDSSKIDRMIKKGLVKASH